VCVCVCVCARARVRDIYARTYIHTSRHAYVCVYSHTLTHTNKKEFNQEARAHLPLHYVCV
jgi:hypothetical protein